jgi:prophage tail gpP-like protein
VLFLFNFAQNKILMLVKINKQDVFFFTSGSISLKLDSIASTFSLSCRFNPENDLHKELFKPLQYLDIEIFNSKEKKIFTGTILNHSFRSNKEFNLVNISGYSKSGILEDVTIPPKMYPLENTSLSLKQIAEKLCNAYGIGLKIGSNAGNVNVKGTETEGLTTEEKANVLYPKTVASPTDTVKGYLAKLCAQRNILLSHDFDGNVVLFKPNDNAKPKYFFNSENTLEMGSDYNGQGMHSEINVVRQPSEENAGVSNVDKAINPLIGKYRPTTKVLSSGSDTDTKKAADYELASELQNITRTVKLVGLFDDLFPGDIVNTHEHGTYSFAYSRYMISEVTLNFNEKEETTDLQLRLPETYSGKVPKNILFFYESHQRHN